MRIIKIKLLELIAMEITMQRVKKNQIKTTKDQLLDSGKR